MSKIFFVAKNIFQSLCSLHGNLSCINKHTTWGRHGTQHKRLFWYSQQGILKGEKYHCTIDLLFDWFGISCMTADNFCFYLQNRLIETSQTGGQWYSDTSPFSIPCTQHNNSVIIRNVVMLNIVYNKLICWMSCWMPWAFCYCFIVL
jgi:hypothetical protein